MAHSEETKQKIRLALTGRVRSVEHARKISESLTGKVSPRKGAVLSEETKNLLRRARANQIHPAMAARGFIKEELDAALACGYRWCGGHKQFERVEMFSAKEPRCKEFKNRQIEKYKEKWTPEQKQAHIDGMASWRDTNADRVRRKWLEKKYGVTPEWYEEKLTEQDGHCALCDAVVDNRKMPSFALEGSERKYLLVDHNHETGVARGLLCAKCNTALHRVEYVQDWAQRALAYLARYA